MLHRLTHAILQRLRLPLLARLVSVMNRFLTGVEMHPTARVGRNAFVINRDVPAHSTVVGTAGRIVKLHGRRLDQELPRTVPPPDAVPVELEV